MRFYIFEPIYKERIWGGDRLAKDLGRTLPSDTPVGESWEIVDRPEAQSVAKCGRTLRELILENPDKVMGAGWPPDRPFPILVKWLDCRERLSLQVHPPESVATELGGQPKTENWYIFRADPDAKLVAGLIYGATKSVIKMALQTNRLEDLLHTISVKNGESIFIPSGRIHAIGGGNLILEIQQNSDTTYRVYDWGRKGLDGNPRKLHIEKSLQSINFDDHQPETLKPDKGRQILAQCKEFDIWKISLEKGESISFSGNGPQIVSVVEGELLESDGSIIPMSSNALLPASEAFHFTAIEKDATVLVTKNFA